MAGSGRGAADEADDTRQKPSSSSLPSSCREAPRSRRMSSEPPPMAFIKRKGRARQSGRDECSRRIRVSRPMGGILTLGPPLLLRASLIVVQRPNQRPSGHRGFRTQVCGKRAQPEATVTLSRAPSLTLLSPLYKPNRNFTSLLRVSDSCLLQPTPQNVAGCRCLSISISCDRAASLISRLSFLHSWPPRSAASIPTFWSRGPCRRRRSCARWKQNDQMEVQ